MAGLAGWVDGWMEVQADDQPERQPSSLFIALDRAA
jgi:hypothetical protein